MSLFLITQHLEFAYKTKEFPRSKVLTIIIL
jgi:hypothetical protein